MENKNRLSKLKKLLYELMPVKLLVFIELTENNWININEQEIIDSIPYKSQIDWEEVHRVCNSINPYTLTLENKKLSIYFKLLKVGNVNLNLWQFRFNEIFAQAVNELRQLSKDSITFNELVELKQLIENNLTYCKVGEYQIDNIRYNVTFEQDIPFHLLIGNDSLSIISAKKILSTYLKKEHQDIVDCFKYIITEIKNKMLEIPNVRETEFRNLLWTDRIDKFDVLEEYLLSKGIISADNTLQMSKKNSALFLYLLGDYGFIRKRVNITDQAYRVKVRKAFEQHYCLQSLADQFKPSDYPINGINPLLLDIPENLLGVKEGINPVLKK